jgi:hypothetical protein
VAPRGVGGQRGGSPSGGDGLAGGISRHSDTTRGRNVQRSILLLPVAPALLPAAEPAGLRFFEQKTRPVLAKECYGCHSPAAKRFPGNFRASAAADDATANTLGGVPVQNLYTLHATANCLADLLYPPRHRQPLPLGGPPVPNLTPSTPPPIASEQRSLPRPSRARPEQTRRLPAVCFRTPKARKRTFSRQVIAAIVLGKVRFRYPQTPPPAGRNDRSKLSAQEIRSEARGLGWSREGNGDVPVHLPGSPSPGERGCSGGRNDDAKAPDPAVLARDTFVTFADMDASPIKAWLIEHRNDPEWKAHYDRAFGKRPAEEIYNLRKNPDEVSRVASAPRESCSGRTWPFLGALTQPRSPRDLEVPTVHQ